MIDQGEFLSQAKPRHACVQQLQAKGKGWRQFEGAQQKFYERSFFYEETERHINSGMEAHQVACYLTAQQQLLHHHQQGSTTRATTTG